MHKKEIQEFVNKKSPAERKFFFTKAIVGSVVFVTLVTTAIIMIVQKPTKVPSTDEGKYVVNGVSFNMKLVEGGTFTMGCTSQQGDDCTDAERPAHNVTVSDFCIGETEVTQELWNAIMNDNPSSIKGDLLPMGEVSWEDCQLFIRKLNALTGKTFRLPTEAEWEYAARGGKHQSKFKYSGSDNSDDVAWTRDNSRHEYHRVKAKSPNTLGLYDMSGGVAEWCSDWYGDYINSDQTNPQGPSSGTEHVVRGGGQIDSEEECRVSYRTKYSYRTFGFRLVLSKGQSQTPKSFRAKSSSGHMFEYRIHDDHKTVSVMGIIGEKSPQKLVISDVVTFEKNTYSVTSIGEKAFEKCKDLKSVSIPNTVTSIEEGAFKSCWELTTINIPNSVTFIGAGAFLFCDKLKEPIYNANCFAYFPDGYATEYTVPDGIHQIAGCAFYGCDNLTTVKIPNSVTSIDEFAFGCCNDLSSVNIPNSVNSIGEGAFYECRSLTSINIPKSVTSISKDVFLDCNNLTTIDIAKDHPVYEVRNDGQSLQLVDKRTGEVIFKRE